MDINKVLFISQQIAPYVPENPVSIMGRELPQGIQEKGIEVRTFMPKFGIINERRNQLHEVIRLSGMNVIIDDTDHPLIIKVATLQPSRMQVYFIYNEDYFAHNLTKELETVSSPGDNDERIIFYARGVIETVRKLRWVPDVIQCNGWVAALAPLYMRTKYSDDPSFRDAKIVVGLNGETIPEPLDARLAEKLEFDEVPRELFSDIVGRQATNEDLLRLTLTSSDAVVQFSPEVPEKVLQVVHDSKLPFLPYNGADTATRMEEITQFYASLG